MSLVSPVKRSSLTRSDMRTPVRMRSKSYWLSSKKAWCNNRAFRRKSLRSAHDVTINEARLICLPAFTSGGHHSYTPHSISRCKAIYLCWNCNIAFVKSPSLPVQIQHPSHICLLESHTFWFNGEISSLIGKAIYWIFADVLSTNQSHRNLSPNVAISL